MPKPEDYELGAKAVDGPRAFYRQLGVTLILKRLADINDQQIHARLLHTARQSLPYCLIESYVIRRAHKMQLIQLEMAPAFHRKRGYFG